MNLIIVFIAVALCSCVLGSPLKKDEDFADIADQEMVPFFDLVRDVRFLVFTRFNPTTGQVFRFRDLESLSRTNFDVSRPTRILIHGFQGDSNSDVNLLLTDAYLRNHDFNIIVVDWSVGANTISYLTASNRVIFVGMHVAELLDHLQDNILFDFSRLTIVGHSLGAHIAGVIGKRVLHGRINSIIGLDPAGPQFAANATHRRLDFTDADYVEVIHTETRTFGIGFVIGHASFFPNNGFNQPGCLSMSHLF